MWPGEVSIGALEGCLAEFRPYHRSALPFARIDEKRTEACALCGRRQAPLESALMDRTDSSARERLDTVVNGPPSKGSSSC